MGAWCGCVSRGGAKRTTQFGSCRGCMRLHEHAATPSSGDCAEHILRYFLASISMSPFFQDEIRVKAIQANAANSLVTIMKSCQDAVFRVCLHLTQHFTRANKYDMMFDAATCLVSSHEGTSLFHNVANVQGFDVGAIDFPFDK
jgi:hypothetical protein